MTEEIFKRDASEYTTQINAPGNYLSQVVKYIMVYKGVDKKEAIRLAKDLISKTETRNPLVRFRYREDNGDRVIREETLTGYIKEAREAGEVIVPTLTCYDNPNKKKSLHAKFLDINIKLRKKDKAAAFVHYQSGDMRKHRHHDTLQKVRKTFNNSLSGTYASKSTVLYNPSQHYTLTSITRSVASIGNAVSESIIAGNKHFRDPDVTLNYLVAIVGTVNMTTVRFAMTTFNLHEPTAEEAMETILYSSRNYWEDLKAEANMLTYLGKLSGEERASIVYSCDLFHLKKYNPVFIRTMLESLARRVAVGSTDNLGDLNAGVEGVNNLVHHICMDDIQGMHVDYSKMKDTPALTALASTARNVNSTLVKYKILFRAFFTTDILPINIAHIRDMHRDAIVLSDTDSTCGSYDKWVDWYFGNTRFTSEAVGLSAAVMTINTQVIDHNIKVFAKNMNIASELTHLLKMKNEYFWSAFVTANVSKHYYANTWIQEGNVYAKPKLELKGVHLISSAGNQDIVNDAHDMMREVNGKVERGETLDPNEYVTRVADAERIVIDLIESGSTSIFKMAKVKELSAYKITDPNKNPYFHHMLWEEIFAEKYGSPGDPTYMVLKVPTTLKSKRKLAEFLDTIEDTDTKEKLTKFLKKTKKEAWGTFMVPMAIAGSCGIPSEILPAVDTKRIVLDNLNVYYVILESMGIYRKPALLFSEMGY